MRSQTDAPIRSPNIELTQLQALSQGLGGWRGIRPSACPGGARGQGQGGRCRSRRAVRASGPGCSPHHSCSLGDRGYLPPSGVPRVWLTPGEMREEAQWVEFSRLHIKGAPGRRGDGQSCAREAELFLLNRLHPPRFAQGPAGGKLPCELQLPPRPVVSTLSRH